MHTLPHKSGHAGLAHHPPIAVFRPGPLETIRWSEGIEQRKPELRRRSRQHFMNIFNIDLSRLDRNGVAAGILVIMTGLGFLIDRFLVRKLARKAKRSGWTSIGIVASGFDGIIFLWLAMLGTYEATREASIPHSLKSDLMRTVTVVLIASGALALARIAIGAIAHMARTGDRERAFPSTTIFANLIRLFFVIVGVLVALDYLGIPITPILTALGVGGLAVALALQQTLANLFAGLQIVATRQIGIGDYVRLKDGGEGFVRDITWRSMVMESVDQTTIIVPNSVMATTIFTNFRLTGAPMSVRFRVTLDGSQDPSALERVATEVYNGIVTEFNLPDTGKGPDISYEELGPTGLVLNVILHTAEFVRGFTLRNEFVRRFLARLREENISIAQPLPPLPPVPPQAT